MRIKKGVKPIAIASLLLVSLNAFAGYAYRSEVTGISREENAIIENNIVDENCYSSDNIGKVGNFDGCRGVLIVDNNMLYDIIQNGGYYADGKLWQEDEVFTGQVTDFSQLFANISDKTFNVANWDTSNVTNMYRTFYNSKNLVVNARHWDTSSLTSLRDTFRDSSNTYVSLEDWNTSNVSHLWGTFLDARDLDMDLSQWDTSSVKTMERTFSGTNLNYHSIASWDTSKVIDMESMFSRYSGPQPIDMSDFDLSSLRDTSTMFNVFRGELVKGSLENLDVSNVTNMHAMFRNTNGIDDDLSCWDVSYFLDNEPTEFDYRSDYEDYPERLPQWGTSGC